MTKKKNKAPSISAQEIQVLLENRHSKDVYVSECKGGPSWGATHMRLDGWAMKKSWANPMLTGYEIKVSRADFLKDDKWMNYLGYCNQFYFVCPVGVIKPEECPEQAGLLHVTSTGSRLYTKKKAPTRDSNEGEVMLLMEYLLMCRTRIVKSTLYHHERNGGAEYWRRWLKKKRDNLDLGWLVKGKINRMYEELRKTTIEENRKLKRQNENLEEAKIIFKELGLNPDYARKSDIKSALFGNITKMKYKAERAKSSLNDFIEVLEKEAER